MKHNGTHCSQSRRNFLKAAGIATVGAGWAGRRAWAGEEAKAEEVVAAKVAVVQNSTIREAVRDAVNMSGGLDFIKPGQRVLIKPNATGGVKHPCCTNPEVLYEVIKMVGDAGCEDIYVGDRSFFFINDVMGVLKFVGHYDAAKQAEKDLGGKVKVTVVPFDQAMPYLKPGTPDVWRQINHPLAKHYTDESGNDTGFRLAEILFQMDHVISVPTAKTHFQAWFTMAMKSFVGMSHPDARKYFHRFSTTNDLRDQRSSGKAEVQPDVTPFTNRLVELNLGFAPRLNIIDGTRPIVYGGPSNGDSQEANVIIASRDRIAADVAGVALLRTLGTEKRLQETSPWKNPMIHYARKLGIGVKSPASLAFEHKGLGMLDQFTTNMA